MKNTKISPKPTIKPTMLIILDGFGHSKISKGNAVKAANMKFFNYLLKNYPNCLLKASGKAVGLPDKYIGNSEVGHMTIGTGRIIETVLGQFFDKIKDKSFFDNKMLKTKLEKLKKDNKALHIMGLLSDGGVHSHQQHLYAYLKFAKNIGLKKVFIHPFLDGRDTDSKSGIKYLKELETFCKKINLGQIASIQGRFYAMDRDNNWDRTQNSYDLITDIKNKNNNIFTGKSWQNILKNYYEQNITDEFVPPTLLLKDGTIKTGDGIIFFNFRPDRARQLTESFIDPNFSHFKIKNLCSTNKTLSFFITTTLYKKEYKNFNNDFLFQENKVIKNTLLDILAKNLPKKHNKVFIIAETEKYAHVTYFFKGLKEEQLDNETRVLIPSIKAKNYIGHPEMSAQKITETLLDNIKNSKADFYLVNYANPDMVGHSGDFMATKKACNFLDKQIEKLYKTFVMKHNGTIFLTSDHGNAEEKIDKKTGKIKTSHTLNPVFFIIINKNLKNKSKIKQDKTLGLANIAPTILNYLGLKVPVEMEKKRII